MLIHANSEPRIPSGFCCVGSAPAPGRAAVRAGRIAGRGGAAVGRDDCGRESLVSDLARRGAEGAESGGPGGPQAAARAAGVARDRTRAAGRPRGAWVHDGVVDVAARRGPDQAPHRRRTSSRPCLAGAAGLRLVAPTPGPAGARTGRGRDRAVEEPALGCPKKNARRQHAWLLFEDESGVSQQPVVRRTWAPRGETPILTPTGGNWKRLSIAGALAFRWDGRRSRFFFQTHRHFRGGRVILIWDGLGGHKSRRMLDFLRRQRRWLTVERLPAYAPDLNPVEQVWGTVKTCELANVCAPDLTTLRTPLRRGFARIRCQPRLAFAFLHHAGLRF